MAATRKSTLDYRDKRWVLRFDYNPDLVTRARIITGSHYNPQAREWDFPGDKSTLDRLIELFMPLNFTEPANSRKLDLDMPKILEKRVALEAMAKKVRLDYTFTRKPYAHQIVAFDWLRSRPFGALFMEMGTGKSKVVVDVVSRHMIAGRVKKALVVAPGSTLENFAKEIQANSPFETIPTCIIGYKYQKEEMIKRLFSTDPRLKWFIINYESVMTFYDTFIRAGVDCIICDESTAIKNHMADRTKAMLQLGKLAKYKYILTGTPITQNLIDLFSQFKFLSEDILGPFITKFRARYTVEDRFHRVVAYNNQAELLDDVVKHSFTLTKDECLDLPPKVFMTEYFDLSEDFQKMYNDMKYRLVAEIEEQEITAQIAIKKIIKLSQIASGFIADDDGKIHMLKGKNTKLDAFADALDRILPQKVVVWCRFHAEIALLKAFLEERGIKYTTLTGMDPISERFSHIEQFQNDSETQVILGTPGAGGKGINLTSSCNVIYFSNDYKLEDRLQSQDRVHRIGQLGEQVTYIDLVGRGTIDQEVLEILSAKKTVLGVIMNQGIRGVLK